MGRLSLLQRIFPTQKLHQDLLHCMHILYQLSYQGRPLEYVSIAHVWLYKASISKCPMINVSGTFIPTIILYALSQILNRVVCYKQH